MSSHAAAVIASIALFFAGLACVIFAQKIGVGFCRLGKKIWKITTFGLTDMHWFYREEKAPFTFRIMGVVLIGMSLMMLIPVL